MISITSYGAIIEGFLESFQSTDSSTILGVSCSPLESRIKKKNSFHQGLAWIWSWEITTNLVVVRIFDEECRGLGSGRCLMIFIP